MIQDIAPRKYEVTYQNKQPGQEDTVLLCSGRCVLMRRDGDRIIFPKKKEITEENICFRYLFSVGGEAYYLGLLSEDMLLEGGRRICMGNSVYRLEDCEIFRTAAPRHRAFAGITGHQLYEWYQSHRYCGHCGVEMRHSDSERMMQCPKCGRTYYPQISPAVIVGILHNGKLLMSKYAGRRYTRFALIAGFCETGEAVEDTVRREVMEEVGLKVKNLRYYKSQPWPFSSSLLMGFFCELDGDDETITLEKEELSMAGFYEPEEVPADEEKVALTWEMMTVFRRNSGVKRVQDLDFSVV